MQPTGPTPKHSKMIQDAMVLHQSGQLDAAEIEYRKLLNLFPRSTNILNELVIIALKRYRVEQGIKLINHSLEINSDQPNLYNRLGYAYQSLNRSDDALASYDLAIK